MYARSVQTRDNEEQEMDIIKESHKFVDIVRFNKDGQVFTSKPFDCSQFRKFMMAIQIKETGDPANSTIEFQVQFLSRELGKWVDYMNGPFGLMLWEEDAIPTGDEGLKVGTVGDCVSEMIRVKVTVTKVGTLDAANYFTATVCMDFMD